MRAITLMMMFVLAGCVSSEPAKTPEGCPNYSALAGPLLQAEKNACLRAYNEEISRARGASITKCYPSADGSFTCING